MLIDKIIFTEQSAGEDDIAKTEQGMNAINVALGAPPYVEENFTLQMLDDGQSIGNLMGKVTWNWMYIDMLWVEPKFQKSGIGTQLMERAEAIAHERKLTGIFVWTQSWQAPGFYKKLGYIEFAKFDDFPPGHQRIGFRKYL